MGNENILYKKIILLVIFLAFPQKRRGGGRKFTVNPKNFLH